MAAPQARDDSPQASAGAGRVEAIWIREDFNGAPQGLERAQVEARRGIVGDRYWRDRTGKSNPEDGRDLTLIEAEAVEGLRADTGIEIGPEESGRNVVTRGIALNDLIGRRFRVGDVECEGVMKCEPCRTFEKRTVQGVLKGMVGRGGLRANVLSGGEIAVGDEITAL
jgi:MOSC domain-containing protein YiiM